MSRLALALTMSLVAVPALSNEFAPALRAFYDSDLSVWVNDPVLVAAIQAQNARTSGYDQATIDELDRTWRAEVGLTSSEVVSGVLDNSAADFLRQHVELSGGVITEAFAMDALGLNVAASAPTSDYWQGDEAKFTETFPKGVGSVHIGEVEFDDSTQTYQGQISVVIVDPDSNTPIGAITIGVNAEALM